MGSHQAAEPEQAESNRLHVKGIDRSDEMIDIVDEPAAHRFVDVFRQTLAQLP